MLVYGDAFLKANEEALTKLKSQMGEAAFKVAIETAPLRKDRDDEVDESICDRDNGFSHTKG